MLRTKQRRPLRNCDSCLRNWGCRRPTKSVSLMEGSAANSILKAARQLDSDLIVLGTNQRKGFTRALVGSVTADVIHDAQRDVLIIPVDERA